MELTAGDEPGVVAHVAVIVLHWGSADVTSRCLHSLSRARFSGKQTVFLIDNARALGGDFARDVTGLDIDLRRPSRNLGFAAGCAWGISLAMDAGADFILLLNNDTIVEPLFLDHLVAEASRAPTSALVCPRILSTGSPSRPWYLGGAFSLWSGIPIQSRGTRRSGPANAVQEVDYATGCVMLIKPSLIRTIGSFDASFFAYCEDLDLSLRATDAGFKILFVPQALVRHDVADRDRLSLSIYYSTRNLLEVMRRRAAWYHWLVFMPNFLVRWVAFFVLLGAARCRPDYIRALAEGIADFARGSLGERSLRT